MYSFLHLFVVATSYRIKERIHKGESRRNKISRLFCAPCVCVYTIYLCVCALPPAAIIDGDSSLWCASMHGTLRSQPVSLTKRPSRPTNQLQEPHPGRFLSLSLSCIFLSCSNLSIVSITREPSHFFPRPLLFTALLFLHSLFPSLLRQRCPLPVCRRVVRIAVCLFLSRLYIVPPSFPLFLPSLFPLFSLGLLFPSR